LFFPFSFSRSFNLGVGGAERKVGERLVVVRSCLDGLDGGEKSVE
jgi:hypothetical protein